MNRARLMALYRVYDPEAKFWSLDEARQMVMTEHPDWTSEQVEQTAARLFGVLCRLDSVWYNSQRRFKRIARLCRDPLCPQATTAADEDAFRRG